MATKKLLTEEELALNVLHSISDYMLKDIPLPVQTEIYFESHDIIVDDILKGINNDTPILERACQTIEKIEDIFIKKGIIKNKVFNRKFILGDNINGDVSLDVILNEAAKCFLKKSNGQLYIGPILENFIKENNIDFNKIVDEVKNITDIKTKSTELVYKLILICKEKNLIPQNDNINDINYRNSKFRLTVVYILEWMDNGGDINNLGEPFKIIISELFKPGEKRNGLEFFTAMFDFFNDVLGDFPDLIKFNICKILENRAKKLNLIDDSYCSPFMVDISIKNKIL